MTSSPASNKVPRDTRIRILEAARTVLVRDGYSAATMRAIAREAGVAVGLANYHFNSRRELLAEVIGGLREHFLGVAEARVPDADGPETLRRILEMVRALIDLMPDWYRLGADLDARALRDESLAELVAANKRRAQEDVREYFGAVCRAFGVGAPEDVDGVTAALLAAFDGLAVRALIDPEFDPVPALKALERMEIAILSPGEAPVATEWDREPVTAAELGAEENR